MIMLLAPVSSQLELGDICKQKLDIDPSSLKMPLSSGHML